MPSLTRPGGVELHYELIGDGPVVAIGDNVFSIPDGLRPLVDDLARDHTVLRLDPRGTGRSTRTGPYDLDTDAGDLEAVLEAVGGDVAVVAPANSSAVTAVCGARRPDLVKAAITPTGPPVPTGRVAEGEVGMAASLTVQEAIGTQLASDYRGLVRTMTVTGNPQMREEDHRERTEIQIERCPQEAALGRWEAWAHSDTTAEALELGDRLWILLHPTMPWFPTELADPLRRVLPEAHVDVIEDGPVSRPDLTAGIVRGITAVNG